jgi:hypothetical protein
MGALADVQSLRAVNGLWGLSPEFSKETEHADGTPRGTVVSEQPGTAQDRLDGIRLINVEYSE